MKNELENLWFNYINELPLDMSDAEEIIKRKWSEKEKDFCSKLNVEQLDVFEEYDNVTANISRICEMHAFFKGIKFATRFMIAVLYEDNL